MKRTDIERMISLADDRYIDEIFQDKITGRRRNIFVTFTAVAAALAVFAGGISYFVSTADKSNDITTDMPAVSMNNTDNSETEPAMQAVSSGDFFKNKGDYPANFYIEWSSEFNGDKQMSFEETYVKTILPFSAEGYSKTRDQFYLYTDENGIPFGASIYFESPFDENASPKIKSISVNVCDKGKLSYPFSIEEFEPINYMYTNIYGFDDTDNFNYSSGVYESVLTAYFTAGGSEYSVSTVNLSAEETVQIVESLIQSGFSAKDFDLSMGGEFEHETTILNFDTANSTEPFAGYVPVVDGLFYLYNDGVTYCTEKMNGKLFSQYMAVVYYDGKEGDGKRVMLEYYTSNWTDKKPFDNVTDLMSVSRKNLGNFMADGEYKFTIKCGGFNINVTAKCGHDELWTYIDAIKSNAGNTFDSITLAEANNIAPYSGFVPQVEKVGGMKLGSVQYNGMNISMDYSGSSGSIRLTYTVDKDTASNYSVMTIEQLIEQDIVFERYDGEDGRYNYTFAVDCKGMYGRFYVCIDGNNCTTGELYDCILTLLMDKSSLAGDVNKSDFTPFGTLAEANKLEPFAGYVPTAKEIGDMKIYTGGGSEVMSAVTEENERMLKINYQSEVKSGNVYGEYDFKAIGAAYTEKKYYIDTTDPVITVEKLPWANLDDLKTDGIREGGRVCYRFIIDCGTCYISVAADCLPEEMKQFIGEITGTAVRDADDEDVKILTIYKVKELAKKGDELTWSDFDGYTFTEGGSGLYIKSYSVEGGYNLMIGGSGRETKPMYIYLSGNGKQRIDIRYDSIDDFLADDKGENLLTMDKVKELAKKGGDLTWSDFEAFDGEDMGSGIYIMVYHVEGTDYTVGVGGGSLDRKPDYIRLGDENGNYIDIRYDSIDDFLNKN